LKEPLVEPYLAIFNQAAVGIAHTRLDGAITRVNQKLCEILGYSADELLARKFTDITHEDDCHASKEFLRKTRGARRLPDQPLCEKRYVRKDGSVIWASVSVALVRGKSREADYIVAMVYDISDRKSTEEHFRATFEQAAVGIAHTTIDRRYFLVNRKLCDTLGYSQAELLQMRSSDITHPDDLVDDETHMDDLLKGRLQTVTGEKRFIRKDGSEVWVNRSVSLVRDNAGAPLHFVRVIEDISERKRAEHALQQSEIAYRSMFEIAAVGKCEVDSASGRFLRVNQKMCEITGYTSDELCAMTFTEITHPDDRLRNLAGSDQLKRGEIADFSIEKRYVRKDGRTIWVNATASMLRDSSGAAVRSIATVQDITERKEVERRLQDSEARFRSLTDLSADWYWEMDADLRFSTTSARADEMTGNSWAGEGVIGKQRWELPYLDVSEAQWDQHKDDLAARRPFRDFELKRLNAHGEVRYISIAGQPMYDADGQFAGYRGVGRDITERKSQEVKIARLSRIRAVLSGINSLIVRVRDRHALFKGACEIAAEEGKFGIAWIGLLNGSTLEMEPMAWAGLDSDSLRSATNSARSDVPQGQGTVGRAIREKRAVFDNDLTMEPNVGSVRRREAIRLGYRSCIALPLMMQGEVAGNVSLYAKEPNFFNEGEVELLNELAGNIAFALEYISKEEKLNYLAYYDALTGLPNRLLFQDRMKHTLVQAQRHNSIIGVMFIDLDGFKTVNDTLGHAIGDKLLQLAATRLQECVRRGDTVARFGGDEFACLLCDLTTAEDASLVAQKILNAFAAPFDLYRNETYITTSIGITLCPIDSESMTGLIKNADTAMYGAKAAGRNNYQFYTAQMNKTSRAKMRLETRLRRAIKRDEFVLHYQPKIDIVSGKMSGLEALIRWQPPDSHLVSPMEFIPLLEDTGLIVPVGELVLREACEQIVAWRKAGVRRVPIAINLSGRQFQQPGLDKLIAGILREYNIDPQWIELEITESMLMQRPDDAIAVLKNLKSLGIRVSVDDFGTGYSSLSYLKRFPIDTLKIDRSFVRDITIDADDAAITRAVVTMAHSLNLKVIAEGVEAIEQLAFLRANECDEAQGFLFSQPLSATDCTILLSTKRHPHPTYPPQALDLVLA
jgi:diguanylate cyclase (GGDEF)-like protein/PAS domain S-box-containing protein